MVKMSDDDRETLAKESVNPEELLLLASDESEVVRRYVADNENTPIPVLEKLSTDEISSVRSVVAGNPNTPLTVLETLSIHEFSSVRRKVAGNSNTSIPVLEKLSTDEDADVRSEVAGNSNTSIFVLEKLSTDEVAKVKSRVAGNSNTPVVILRFLAFEKCKDGWVRREIALNIHTPGDILTALASDKDEFVRGGVAVNENTPESTLKVLASDKKAHVRQCVAINPNTPRVILESLVSDKNQKVRYGAEVSLSVNGNNNTSESVIKALDSTKSQQDLGVDEGRKLRVEEGIEYVFEIPEYHYGFKSDGGGIVVYLLNSERGADVIPQIVDALYTDVFEDDDKEDVQDWSEYDPSTLETVIAGELSDELTMAEVVEKIGGDASNIEKFQSFLKEVMDASIPLVFIDSVSKRIYQIEKHDIMLETVKQNEDKLRIYIREYDHGYDY